MVVMVRCNNKVTGRCKESSKQGVVERPKRSEAQKKKDAKQSKAPRKRLRGKGRVSGYA